MKNKNRIFIWVVLKGKRYPTTQVKSKYI